MMYDERFVTPMRQELTRLGVEELRTADEVDARVEKLAEEHGISPSDAWIQLEKSGQIQSLEAEITEEKVFAFLLSQSTVEEVKS